MSEGKQNKDGKNIFAAIGVVAIDYSIAGFPELKKFAEKWAADKNFKTIIVRKVSPDNWGIQFVYIDKDSQGREGKEKWEQYFKQLEKEFKIIYAYDIDEGIYDNFDRLKQQFVVNLPIELK